MNKKRILSGMQPSGRLHIGNLLGALNKWVAMQEEYDCYYFVADWHALSTSYEDTREIKENVFNMLVDWLAAGVDPEKATIFIQSRIPEHATLYLLLGMITPVSWLERNPTYKEKMEEIKGKDLATYGFLGYPVLQAADILIYKANMVPVGVDQLPHLELTREVARRFNYIYKKDLFVEPDTLMSEVLKLLGTDNRKMSKSYGNAIMMADTSDEVKKKVSTMVTDPQRIRRNDPGDPEVCNVYSFHKLFTDQGETANICASCQKAEIGCTDCKAILAKNLNRYLKPMQERRTLILAKPEKVWEAVDEGTLKAQKIAKATMKEVQEAIRL